MSMERKGIRSGTRIPIELPVSIRWEGAAGVEQHAKAETANISGNGLFLRTSLKLPQGTQLQLILVFPLEVTKVPTHLHCKGHVVRQEARTSAAGFGVVIDDYELLCPPKPA